MSFGPGPIGILGLGDLTLLRDESFRYFILFHRISITFISFVINFHHFGTIGKKTDDRLTDGSLYRSIELRGHI